MNAEQKLKVLRKDFEGEELAESKRLWPYPFDAYDVPDFGILGTYLENPDLLEDEDLVFHIENSVNCLRALEHLTEESKLEDQESTEDSKASFEQVLELMKSVPKLENESSIEERTPIKHDGAYRPFLLCSTKGKTPVLVDGQPRHSFDFDPPMVLLLNDRKKSAQEKEILFRSVPASFADEYPVNQMDVDQIKVNLKDGREVVLHLSFCFPISEEQLDKPMGEISEADQEKVSNGVNEALQGIPLMPADGAGIGPSNEMAEIMSLERQAMVERIRKLKFFGGEKHAAITFKLSYELDLPPDWEAETPVGFRAVQEGEGSHLSKFRMGHLVDVFSSNLFLAKDDKGMKVPLLWELDLTCLKSMDTLRTNFNDPATKWAKLIGVDLIPYKGRGGVSSARLGFVFQSLTGRIVDIENYRKFISQRRFGKVRLCRFKEKKSSRTVCISQIIDEIRNVLFQGKSFDLQDAFKEKIVSGNQPQIVQFLLFSSEDGEEHEDYWKEFTGRSEFRKASEIISTVSEANQYIPRTKARIFEMKEGVDTKYSIHHRGITGFSFADNQFNRETKPLLTCKAFHFISILARIAVEAKLDPRNCEMAFDDVVRIRKEFFRQCMNYYSTDE
jgi:hypothetical protein